MRRGALRVIVACAVGALALGGFETVAHGDLLPPLPTTTVTVPVPPLPTSTTVPLPPVTTVTVRPPTTTTVRPPTTSVRLPTTTVPAPTTSVRLPTTTVPAPTTTTVHVTVPPTTTTPSVRLPTTTSPPTTSPPPRSTTSTTAQGGGAAPVTTSGAQPPSASGGAAAPANATSARVRPISGPAIQAVIAGSKPARAKARARTRGAAAALPVLHAARVSAKTPGLAAFYAGLEKALANGTPAVVKSGTSPQFLLPAGESGGGVLSRTGALMLAVALFILALLLAFALLPRLAAIGFLPVSRTAAQAARESSFVALGAIALCALLAILLLRTAL